MSRTECSSGYCGWDPASGDPHTCPDLSGEHGPPDPKCLWCGHVGVPVEVAGHTQCSNCNQVIESCCG